MNKPELVLFRPRIAMAMQDLGSYLHTEQPTEEARQAALETYFWLFDALVGANILERDES